MARCCNFAAGICPPPNGACAAQLHRKPTASPRTDAAREGSPVLSSGWRQRSPAWLSSCLSFSRILVLTHSKLQNSKLHALLLCSALPPRHSFPALSCRVRRPSRSFLRPYIAACRRARPRLAPPSSPVNLPLGSRHSAAAAPSRFHLLVDPAAAINSPPPPSSRPPPPLLQLAPTRAPSIRPPSPQSRAAGHDYAIPPLDSPLRPPPARRSTSTRVAAQSAGVCINLVPAGQPARRLRQ